MKCEQCGASLTPEELSSEACAYCGAALPHAARAAEKAALVNRLLADDNHNGIPDVFEKLGAGSSPGQSVSTVNVSTEVMVNGKLVTNLDELPPEARRMVESLGRIGAGTPGDAASAMASIEKAVAGAGAPGRVVVGPLVESAERIRLSNLALQPERRTSGAVWAIVGALAALVAVLAVLLALR